MIGEISGRELTTAIVEIGANPAAVTAAEVAAAYTRASGATISEAKLQARRLWCYRQTSGVWTAEFELRAAQWRLRVAQRVEERRLSRCRRLLRRWGRRRAGELHDPKGRRVRPWLED